jgi:hypothetical protein
MSRPRVAFLVGLAFLAVAIAGFLTTPSTMEARMEHAPRLVGLFPVNLLHNLIHLVFGVWGLVAARSALAARTFLRIAGGIYLSLAALAFVSPTTFGLVPIGGHDIWLHLLFGVTMAYFGLVAPAAVPLAPRSTP